MPLNTTDCGFILMNRRPGEREGPLVFQMRIPVKANTDPEGKRTVFRDKGEQQSERSDAGGMIVPEVFAMVKGRCRAWDVRSGVEEP